LSTAPIAAIIKRGSFDGIRDNSRGVGVWCGVACVFKCVQGILFAGCAGLCGPRGADGRAIGPWLDGRLHGITTSRNGLLMVWTARFIRRSAAAIGSAAGPWRLAGSFLRGWLYAPEAGSGPTHGVGRRALAGALTGSWLGTPPSLSLYAFTTRGPR